MRQANERLMASAITSCLVSLPYRFVPRGECAANGAWRGQLAYECPWVAVDRAQAFRGWIFTLERTAGTTELGAFHGSLHLTYHYMQACDLDPVGTYERWVERMIALYNDAK